jgi:hypothetical protein
MNNRFIIGVLIFVFAVGILIGCHTCKSPDPTVIVKTDTVQVIVHDSSGFYTPTISVIEGGRIPDSIYVPLVAERVDSFIVYERQPVDSAAILKDYFAHVHYKDTLHTQYGPLYVSDDVTENRIALRKWNADFMIPTITKTVTITPKKRNEVYAGMIIQGNQKDIFTGVGPSLAFKNKRDKLFEAAALLGRDGRRQYQAGLKLKISLRKH